ncbi:cysteine--tRNA ligase [Candidatus Schneideria nysicola]|uniref:cysteine--tRNA ligase n=1 Tax=Candidatus Schneideria nysicola TaxID=1081631 RepID=UPI001CAA4F8F|nr:cysteine--tRNA ligase [Candidatus Schneideria nysicola]UAJ65710.1 cysteine--tRNA ligase [Candidatus Schneideria nysicola]
MLSIFNTLTKRKEIFYPIHFNHVNIYVCGVTAYDLCHIGHIRTFLTFDIVIRYLKYCGYQVNYVRNITDIDDKIILRATQNGENPYQLVDRMINAMHLDLDALDIIRPNYEPRVTQHISDIIIFIKQLINKGHAYIASNGDIMFSVSSYKNYGILSHQKIEKLRTQSRTSNNDQIKENPLDFVLWKMAKPNQPNWPSPWGLGRPGWHIECSAISCKELGNYFDIHGGGSDLIFPHHENEIAQSVCAHNSPYVNIWMHSGMVMIDKKKISKSLNNIFFVRDILSKYESEVIRYFLMSSHYRSPIHYKEENIKKSQEALKNLYIALRGTHPTTFPINEGKVFIDKFNKAMNDDFNTPKAYLVLFELAHEVNKLKSERSTKMHDIATILRYLANIIGILKKDPDSFLQKQNTQNCDITLIEKIIQKRNIARKNKEWNVADNLRDQLLERGVILEDGLEATTWRWIDI